MGHYCFANWVSSPDGGKEPLLPKNYGCLLLADFGPNTPWAIFDVSFVEDQPVAEGLEEVDDDLRILLNSAKAYSPAMALACHDVSRRWERKSPSRSDFAVSLVNALRQSLRAQTDSRYRLAEAVVNELGYLVRGGYVWILGYNSVSHKVSWVSWDFQIYQNSSSDFDLDDEALVALSGR